MSTTGTSASKVRPSFCTPHCAARLKKANIRAVMRACEGCRRRKIKCDAATTNAWPCAACIRLKLNCVPPTVSYDKDFNGSQTFELEPKPLEYASPDSPTQNEYHRHPSITHGMPHQMPPAMAAPVSGMYQSSPYVEHQQPQESIHYQPMSQPQPQPVQQSMGYAAQQAYSQATAHPPIMTMTPPESEPAWRNDSVSNLSDALGELKIDHTAVGKDGIYCPLPETITNFCSALYHEHEKDFGGDACTRGI